MKDRLALVTGSTGFIGSRLTNLLVQTGWNVRVTVRGNSRTDHLDRLDCARVVVDLAGATPHSVDRVIDEALDGVTHVFHLAGRLAGRPAELDQVNRRATETLARRCAATAAPPVFVLVSSAAAGGPSDSQNPRRPSDPPAPISHYGISKLAGERAAIAHAPRLPLTVVRPGIVFGEGDREFINLIRTMIRFRISPMIGPGTQPLSLIEVEDLCRLLVAAAQRGQRVQEQNRAGDSPEGIGIYNAADAQSLSLREIAQLVRDLPGTRRVVDLPLPVRLGYFVGAVSEGLGRLSGRASTLTRDKITEASAAGWAIDPSTSQTDLLWQPAQTIAAQLRATCLAAIEQGRC